MPSLGHVPQSSICWEYIGSIDVMFNCLMAGRVWYKFSRVEFDDGGASNMNMGMTLVLLWLHEPA